MRNKGFFVTMAAALAVSASLGASAASDDAASYKGALSDNLAAASAFLAEPLGKAFAFNVASQGFAPPGAKSLLGFNIGLGGGVAVTAIDKSGVKGAALSNGTDLTEFSKNLPDTLPVPLGLLEAHLGLPKVLFFEALDVGLRLRSFNLASGKNTIDLSGFGVELRGNVFEAGLVSPVTLTLGLGMDSLTSAIKVRSDAASTSGSFGGSTITGTSAFNMDVDSQIQSYNLFATVSRKFLFVIPYAGLGLNVISGDTTVTGAQVSDLTFSNGGTYQLTDTIEGKSTKPAPSLDLRLGGGLQLDVPFFFLEVGGEYGVISGGAGGHAQLGFKFK